MSGDWEQGKSYSARSPFSILEFIVSQRPYCDSIELEATAVLPPTRNECVLNRMSNASVGPPLLPRNNVTAHRGTVTFETSSSVPSRTLGDGNGFQLDNFSCLHARPADDDGL